MESADVLLNSSPSVYALQSATAVIEAGAGFALLIFPSKAARLLLGAPLDAPDAMTVARIGGMALLTLGAAFWLARGDSQSLASKGMIAAIVLYNLGAAFVLGAFGIGSQRVGVAFMAGGRAAYCHDCLVRYERSIVRPSRRARESPSVVIAQ